MDYRAGSIKCTEEIDLRYLWAIHRKYPKYSTIISMKFTILPTTFFLAAVSLASGQEAEAFFNLNNATVSTAQIAAGTTFTYVGADPTGLYDVVVTVTAIGANSTIFSNPQGDAFTGFTGGGNFPDAASFFTPSWNLNDGTVAGTFTASITFEFSVFNTGTMDAASIDLHANTLDNDGGLNGTTSSVRERVIYGGNPEFLRVGAAETQVGNQFTATNTTNQPGIGTGADFRIDALYRGTSTFSWTAQHLVTDFAPDGGNSTRLSALQLGFTTVPEPDVPSLAALGISLIGLRRRRASTKG